MIGVHTGPARRGARLFDEETGKIEPEHVSLGEADHLTDLLRIRRQA
jgi:hypothetical protein